MKQNQRKPWLQAALVAVLIVAAGVALWRWHEPIWEFFDNQEKLQAWIGGFGPWAPVVSIGLNAAQVLVAPIPGQIVGVANGYLYGVWLGTLYSMIGLLLGRTLAMALARWLGRGLVERLVKAEQLARWDRLVHRRGALFFFLVFLFPSLPDDIVCLLAGLSPLSLPYLIALSTIGGFPGVFVSCWAGANATKWPWQAWIPIVAVGLALAWVFWRYQDRLEGTMVDLIQRLTAGRDGESQEEE